MEGLLYPKQPTRKKRKKHRRSILHDKSSRTCYLCMTLHNDWNPKRNLEEHHIFGGPNRSLSEEYGLKVYLCTGHHRCGPEAVHQNAGINRQLQAAGQRAFIEEYPKEDFQRIFGRNYME
jgi:hypothetical protein